MLVLVFVALVLVVVFYMYGGDVGCGVCVYGVRGGVGVCDGGVGVDICVGAGVGIRAAGVLCFLLDS